MVKELFPIKLKKADKITVFKNPEGEIRWTRKTSTNHKIVGASTQPYNSVKAALANIHRTQRGPFILVNEVS